MRFYCLISPRFDEIKKVSGDSLGDALESFRSEVWQQGYGADQKLYNTYQYYLIYEMYNNSLTYKGQYNEYM